MKNNNNLKKFVLLWGGELISSIGGGLTTFGLLIYVFDQTSSATSMALVSLMAFLPSLLLSVPAGVLADKYDRRMLMMIGDGFSAIGIIYILVCMLNGNASLNQILLGVTISSVFSSLLEPSYRATVTDILTKDDYSKAIGMVNIAESAKFLISPILAAFLLSISSIEVLLIIDISTFFLTVVSTGVVKKKIKIKQSIEKNINKTNNSFWNTQKEGFKAITEKKGILILVIVASIITWFMGVIQILAGPMILDFNSSKTFGIVETICSFGMLVSSVLIGIRGIKKNYVKILSISLFLAGVNMIGFGILENIYIISLFGFLFFAMLPFTNNCLDYLVRTNIPNKLQGRAWGVIGFLSQIGYVIAYSTSGFIADFIGKTFSIGVGRGSARTIVVAGILLAITAVILSNIQSVKNLEGEII